MLSLPLSMGRIGDELLIAGLALWQGTAKFQFPDQCLGDVSSPLKLRACWSCSFICVSLGSLNTLVMRCRPPSQQMVPLMGSEVRTPCFESFICYFLNIALRWERPTLPPIDPHLLTVGYIDCPRIVRKDVCMRKMPCIPGILGILFYICINNLHHLRDFGKD